MPGIGGMGTPRRWPTIETPRHDCQYTITSRGSTDSSFLVAHRVSQSRCSSKQLHCRKVSNV